MFMRLQAIELSAVFALLVTTLGVTAGEPFALSTELVVSGLDSPTFVTAPEGDSRLFVLEQNSAQIRIVRGHSILDEPFLDLSDLVMGGGEGGLLCLAFHPDYAENGRLFVTYTDLSDDIVLASYQVDPGDPDHAVANSGRVLLDIPKPFSQHNGGMIAFSPLDGTLFMSTGDGGAGGDPFNHAQDLSSLLGKLLRIDVDVGGLYAIPADNPFVSDPTAAPEIYAYGLRNPWRFSFDRRSGAILIGDVGQEGREEINLIRGGHPGGQNFGWRCMEGTTCTGAGAGACGCPAPDTVAPIHEYDHNEGCAVMGGYVYRGDALPEIRGRYFFADYCTSRVWSAEIPSATAIADLQEHTLALNPAGGTLGFITSFGLDGDRELLIVGETGVIHRVVPAEPNPDCDGDGVDDAQEIALGSAFDVNADAIPDDCQLLLTANGLVVGQLATLDFFGAAPFQPLAWFASWRGTGNGPCLFGGALCLDLLPVSLGGGQFGVPLLGFTTADAQGHGSLSFVVPDDVPGDGTIAFQALAAAGAQSVKSNPILKLITAP